MLHEHTIECGGAQSLQGGFTERQVLYKRNPKDVLKSNTIDRL
jgi:hypothetical protein